jgi:hypothetical protein
MQAKYCGKWAVSSFKFTYLFHPLAERSVQGFGSSSQGVEERSYKQSPDLHQISQTSGNVGVPSECQT